MKVISNRKCQITVKRPNGQIETITHPSIDYMVDGVFAQMKTAMLSGGRGEAVSYKNIAAITEMEECDYVCSCQRCGKKIDKRTAHNQREGKFDTYYCNDCATLLNNIGKGEATAMEERKA